MSVGEQDEIDGRKVLDSEAAALDSFQQEQPIREVRVDQNIEIGELDEERCVTDPSKGNLALCEFREFGTPMLSCTTGQQGFPDHFVKECAWTEMFRWS